MNLKYGSRAPRIKAMLLIIVIQVVFGDYSVAQATTKLVFRARTGNAFGISIPVGTQVPFKSIDVSQYRKIRIIAKELPGSVSGVYVTLMMMEGGDSVGELEPLTLTPGTSQTKVFDVPGTSLGIIAQAQASGRGSNTIEILIYGSD